MNDLAFDSLSRLPLRSTLFWGLKSLGLFGVSVGILSPYLSSSRNPHSWEHSPKIYSISNTAVKLWIVLFTGIAIPIETHQIKRMEANNMSLPYLLLLY